MKTDFDNLIRSARPEVPAAARERVLDYVGAHGAVASAPAPFRTLPARHSLGVGVLRVAALVMLALLAGIAAALVATPSPQPATTAQLPDIAPLAERVAALETDLPVAELNAIADRIDALETRKAESFEAAVTQVINARETRQAELWRERHIEHVREHFAREREATIERMREELGLSPEQEKQVREVLEETGRQAESLIGDFYTRGHHHDRQVGDKFAQLAADTDKKLEALLDRQQREMIESESGIVSAAPEDWAPSSEFRDGTDLDVWTNWITVTRD
ncbi:MAG: hypothetical protein H6839_15750 [Planctomycetes bacterium]|nr:hypothetical protein [Planctomycetota bacterium]